uniref:TRASH domain-containing protein n=1 Tax=Myripristis murdjan TaxID=586833 RepID=A0A667ZJM4_9TELE
ALLPQSSIRQIKEELEHQENIQPCLDKLLILPPQVPAPGPPPQQATIFIPGRSAVLQAAAVAPLPLRPPVPGSLQALAPVAPPPAQPPIPGSVRCSGCSKVLLKGQTAFQRKGSTQLFCSTVCLTGHLPPAVKARTCFQCNKYITQPKDMIMIPLDNNTYMHFCGHFCLSVFRHKKKQTEKQPDKRLEKRPDKRIEHEVTHQGRLHRLCSNACFLTWRKMRQLAMNCCEGCGLYCNSNSGSCQTLTIERSQLNFCSPTCIGTYKQVCGCFLSSTIMEKLESRTFTLFSLSSDTPFPCCLCKVTAVPQYHLAMVDGTIRNFCSYDCVSTYRKMEHAPQPDLMNGTSTFKDPSFRDVSRPGPSVGASSVPPLSKDFSSPMSYPGHHPSHTSVPPLLPSYPTVRGQALAKAPPGQHPKPGESSANDPSKLTCHQCSTQFSTKPLLFSHQGRISMFCSKTCCEQYKTQRNILVPCEYCKLEKVHFDVISYNQQDLFFCSESCKLLFKHDLTSRNKDQPWRPCTYCSSIGQKMLHSHYGGRLEEFCRPHCMSQYTVLYYGMARCDSCRKQGYMTEKLQCLGSVRNFCTLPCLLQYCSLHFETNQRSTSNGTGSASAPLTPYGALPTSNAHDKNLDNASTQTDAMRVPASRRRQMKNKSVLCRPFTMDQEILCQMPTESAGNREEKVKVVMVPVPVPVFIPVPMNMYSQHTPVPVAMTMPVSSIHFCPVLFSSILWRTKYGINHLENYSQFYTPHTSMHSLCGVALLAHPLVLKEDILQCDSTELSFALCRFIKEVRRPNGETYSPDSIFYLCLGIQQYLFEKGRIENIFTDELYNLFATEITSMLQHWKPKLLPSGGVASSRVEEGYLWECKQLGAYSPIVLLNTLLFFCTKTFSLTTLAQHKRLSFTNLTRQSRPCSRTGKIHYLRYQRSGARQETEEGDLEMPENTTNPLHCPVRLYEFYLSRCPETVKTRTDMFYLQPEESVHTNSPYWYTCQPLEASTLQSMLTRILAVREVLQGVK